MNNKLFKDTFVVGFALFAMFFGAGNLIFPPFLGWMSGENWVIGFLCFIIIDVGLSLLALMVVANLGKGAMGISEKFGRKISFLILSLNAVCLGPLIAIPRTAATTFEFAVVPVTDKLSSWIFTAVFFALVVILSIRQTKAVDIVGAVLAPIMFVALLYLIFTGITSPLGLEQDTSEISSVVKEGILSGYQTMDMMAALVFSAGLIVSVKDKGYKDTKSQFKIIALSGAVSAAALFIVYGGLTYLGSTVSVTYKEATNADILIRITNDLLGKSGVVVLGVIVATACLTTAVGLVSSSASFFTQATQGKIEYKWVVIVFSLVSFILSNMGLNTIIQFAAPILDLIYPVLVILIFGNILGENTVKKNTLIFSSAAAFAVCVIIQIEKMASISIVSDILPLSDYGFAWLVPALIMGIIGNFVKSKENV